MSDSSFPPPPADGSVVPPVPAAPPSGYPLPPVQAYPGAAPTYPAAPSNAPSAPAVPPAPPAYGSPNPTYGAAPGQGYGAPVYSPPPAPQQTVYPAYGSPGYPAYAPPRPTSGLAVASLVCGLAGLLLSWLVVPALASVAAVITGHMALKQTSADANLGGRGMAVAGLILGYIVVAFLALSIVMSIISVVAFGAFTLPFIFAS